MDIDGAYCENDGPRELEIFSDDQVEEVMESLEYYRSKIEQLQLYCEQVSQSKLRSDEALLEQKRKHKDDILKYQEKVNVFRSINVQLMSGNTDKKDNSSVSSFCCSIDSESNESRMQEMESKLTSLELTLAEKEKHVSVMEWQIMDMEATIATLQAERDQLILELDLHDSRASSMIESSENLGGLGNENEYRSKNDLRCVEKESRRKTKTLAFERPHSHSDLWEDLRGPENLSLKQLMSLSAGWLPKDSRMRRPPQRTYSDYMKRDSQFVDFSTRKSAHSLEDFDNLSEVDSGLGLGRLTRTTNFCDILDADEYSNFHVTDNRLSFTEDSVQEERVSNDGEPDTESSRESLAKKWETFDGDMRNKETGGKTTPENDIVILENAPTEEPFGTFDGHSVASSTSDFSSVFHSSQDGLLTSSNNESYGELVVPDGPYQKISKKNISKSDSCISMKRSPSSDKEDMWNFTPDSILNVSTGEVLSSTITDMPSIPTITKSQSFTSSLEIILKDPKSNANEDNEERTANDVTEDTEDVDGNTGKVSEKPEDIETVLSHTSSVIVGEESVKLRNTLGESLRVKHGRKSKSVIESTHQTQSSELGAAVHQKSLSDPVKDGENNGRRKFIEYQKWRKYGRRGKPPGDLRISNC